MQQIEQPPADACLEIFFPQLSGLVIEDVTDRGRYVLLTARTSDGSASCPAAEPPQPGCTATTSDFCRTYPPADERY